MASNRIQAAQEWFRCRVRIVSGFYADRRFSRKLREATRLQEKAVQHEAERRMVEDAVALRARVNDEAGKLRLRYAALISIQIARDNDPNWKMRDAVAQIPKWLTVLEGGRIRDAD